MTTSQTQFFTELSAGHSGPTIPEAKRVYFQTRLRNRVFNFILTKFLDEQKNGLTKAVLARRIGKTPDVINRWLGAPSNLTVDTIGDLLLGISGEELEPIVFSPSKQLARNFLHSDWIDQAEQSRKSHPLERHLGHSTTQGSDERPIPPALRGNP